jgi:hypothetical protein
LWCTHCSPRPDDLILSSKVKVENFLKPEKAIATLANSADFELNHQVVQGLQLSGNGKKEGYSILSGMMNMNCNPNAELLDGNASHNRQSNC